MKLSNIETNRLKIYAASQKVLKKAGFVPTGEIGDEGPRYEMVKEPFYVNCRLLF